jgi:nitrate/nitrite transport system substrate-binding protein
MALLTGQLPAPEKTCLTVGMVPLVDCAPLVIAKEKGFFSKNGLDVSLSREVSWANIRDKLAIGALDAAQMLAPMPIASSLGIDAVRKATVTAFTMGLNGNAITVSNALYEQMMLADAEAMASPLTCGRALKKVISQQKTDKPLRFAMVFPVSTHNYQIRYWLASSCIDPDKDVHLTVIPPVHMVANLEAGLIDGYCVGEPWNSVAVAKGIGRAIVSSYDIWNNSPEKVLGVNGDWAEKHPNTHLAMIVSLLEAAQWIDIPENRREVTEILSRPEYIDIPVDILRMSMMDTANDAPDCNVFYRYAANYPWHSHALWFISQMIRWGQITHPLDALQVVKEVYRPDIYRKACCYLGLDAPDQDMKQEGIHGEAWQLGMTSGDITLGSDRFIDGRVFNPERLAEYLENTQIHSMSGPAAGFFHR